jgi:hypothetical protein
LNDGRTFPPLPTSPCSDYGIAPLDFYVEAILEQGIADFRENKINANDVYGHLNNPILATRYGQGKIDEIKEFINTTEIRVTQSFPDDAVTIPVISINLASSIEVSNYTGLDDFAMNLDVLDGENSVVDRTEIGYNPIRDEVLIGVHGVGSPDQTKYLYMLTIYILQSFKDFLEEKTGLFNISFRATDLSRVNEQLPSHLFTRFISLATESFSLIKKSRVPIAQSFDVDVKTE